MEVRFLEGHLSWEGSSRKALRPGGEDLEIPFPHSTRSPQLGSEWSWLGNPAKTFRNPSEGENYLFMCIIVHVHQSKDILEDMDISLGISSTLSP